MHRLSVSPLWFVVLAASCLFGFVCCAGRSETSAGAASGGAGGAPGDAVTAGSGGSAEKAIANGHAGNGGDGGVGDRGCQPILTALGLDTGFENCQDGTKRRRVALPCPTEETDLPLGACFQDSDCEAGSICECGISVGTCKPATCRSGADCDPGFGCVSTALVINPNTYEIGVGGDGNLVSGVCYYPTAHASYACQVAGDACHIDRDCATTLGPMAGCVLLGANRDCVGMLCPE